jgi:ribosomal protein S18 acetylase RimI-like enzyme
MCGGWHGTGAMQAAVEGPLRRLLPPQVVYSNERSLLTPAHVRELWEETLPGRQLTDEKLQLVIDKSFSVTLALLYEPCGLSLGGNGPLGAGGAHGNGGAEPPPRKYKLVGLARSMSDAAFVATVCDVAVSPALQRRGVGRRLVRNLVTDMRSMGPSSFAVRARRPFPPHKLPS